MCERKFNIPGMRRSLTRGQIDQLPQEIKILANLQHKQIVTDSDNVKQFVQSLKAANVVSYFNYGNENVIAAASKLYIAINNKNEEDDLDTIEAYMTDAMRSAFECF